MLVVGFVSPILGPETRVRKSRDHSTFGLSSRGVAVVQVALSVHIIGVGKLLRAQATARAPDEVACPRHTPRARQVHRWPGANLLLPLAISQRAVSDPRTSKQRYRTQRWARKRCAGHSHCAAATPVVLTYMGTFKTAPRTGGWMDRWEWPPRWEESCEEERQKIVASTGRMERFKLKGQMEK